MNSLSGFFVFILGLFVVMPVSAAKPIIMGGAGADLATFRLLAEAFKKHQADSQIKLLPSLGSSGAVRGVSSGRVDIGLIARPLMEQEKQYDLTEIHYADTALVYVVAKGHPLENIDTPTLKALYRGEHVAHSLKIILRPKLDSDTLLLEEKLPDLIPALTSAFERKGVPVGMTDQMTIDLLLGTENTISISSQSLVISEQRPLQVLSLNGVKPSIENLSDGSYPLRKKLFMVHDGMLTDRERQFVEFVFTAEGKAILRQTGHIPAASRQ